MDQFEYTQTWQLNNDFRTCLYHLKTYGLEANPRGTITKELLNYNITLLDPRNRIINFPDRKTNLKYLLGEFIWYLSGSNNPDDIIPYSKFWDNIRNSGDAAGYPASTINSNYGTRMFGHSELPAFTTKASTLSKPEGVNQWHETVELLKRDKDTRQAIMNIHVPSDRHIGNKDVACTLSLQFFIRDNKLFMITNMRSNDIILGFTNDVFQFTMLQECLMLQLRETYPELELGQYYHNAGSMHIYDRHFDMMDKIVDDTRALELSMVAMDKFDHSIKYTLIALEQFWREAGMPKDFDFSAYKFWENLTPYWQALVRMCFNDDHDAMHKVFGIPEHDHDQHA